jgi:hypothetical protein
MLSQPFPKSQFQKTYFHEDEEILLVFTQNNVFQIADEIERIRTGKDPQEKVMNDAWMFYKEYIEWEDQYI